MRDHLLAVARSGTTTTYSAVAGLVGLDMESPADRNRISEILDGISEGEHNAGRPLLSVVVIRNDRNMPGDGFFTMARRVGKLHNNDNLQFFIEELRRAHDYWHAHPQQ